MYFKKRKCTSSNRGHTKNNIKLVIGELLKTTIIDDVLEKNNYSNGGCTKKKQKNNINLVMEDVLKKKKNIHLVME